MGGDDSEATLLLAKRENFEETFAAVRIWDVPASDRYPDGVRYSMQYGHRDTPDGQDATIVRYDNFPDHPGASHHHKHTADGRVVDVDFTGVFPVYERFKREVREHGEPWND